jgi:hypothetical protein
MHNKKNENTIINPKTKTLSFVSNYPKEIDAPPSSLLDPKKVQLY